MIPRSFLQVATGAILLTLLGYAAGVGVSRLAAADATCSGAALTTQAQVQPNTPYCGGTATQQIRLAAGDTWTNGTVSGAISVSQQRGALECSGNCTLVNTSVLVTTASWAAFYAPGGGASRLVNISGGRFSGAGSLGLGLSGSTATVSGSEIDHNGSTASCGFEGGGSKWVGQATISNVNVHDNTCPGLWSDLGGSGSVSNSTLTNNGSSGLFVELSNGVHLFGNTLSHNGLKDANGCGWYWDGDITVSTSSNVEIDHNKLTSSCNGITAVEQNRTLNGSAVLTRNVNVHDNTVALNGGKVGFVSDNGDQGIYNVASNHFQADSFAMSNCNASAFGWQGGTHSFPQWQGFGMDTTGSCGLATPPPTPTATPSPTPSPTGYTGTCSETIVNGKVTGGSCT